MVAIFYNQYISLEIVPYKTYWLDILQIRKMKCLCRVCKLKAVELLGIVIAWDCFPVNCVVYSFMYNIAPWNFLQLLYFKLHLGVI